MNITKQQEYDEMLPQLAALIAGEHEEMSVLANVCAVLKERFGWFWVGFYLAREGELRLGPFQGPLACMHIAFGRGVCGTAFERKESIVVDDVEQFPGHIACSNLSRSEIVVPLFDSTKQPVGVLDIDSTELATFDETDRINLQRVCQLITETLYKR
jgi:GAF domain-containing protein